MKLLDKISKNFSKKSKCYDDSADIQKISANALYNYSQNFIKPNSKILDIGSGTGFLAKKFTSDNQVFQADISFDMCKNSSKNATKKEACAINANFHHLPFKAEYFDFIISSYAIHWSDDFEQLFAEVNTCLKAGGYFIFCLPAANSLREVKQVFAEAEQQNIINNFPQAEHILAGLNNFRIVETFQQVEALKYDDLWHFLRKIKAIGGATKLHQTKDVLTKKSLKKASEIYQQKYADENNEIKVFWDNLYIITRKI